MLKRLTNFVSPTLLIALVFAASGCKHSINRKLNIQRSILDHIKMPVGSAPVDKYARYYTFGAEGMIDAVFIIQADDLQNSLKRECKITNNMAYPCNKIDFDLVRAGQDKWLSNPRYLPALGGGGCSFIRIKYNATLSRFTSVNCNGDY